MATAIVMAGSTRARPAATGSAQPCRGNPPEGNVPASRANSQIRITPTQKIGTATPTWDSAETASPTGESRRTAASVDRKSTRLNSSHVAISYAVFCLKKKRQKVVKSQHHQEP